MDECRVLAEQVETANAHVGRLATGEQPYALAEDRQVPFERLEVVEAGEVERGVGGPHRRDEEPRRPALALEEAGRETNEAVDGGEPTTPKVGRPARARSLEKSGWEMTCARCRVTPITLCVRCVSPRL